MVTFVCWKWQSNNRYRHLFRSEHVNEWEIGLRRALQGEKHHRLVCITDDPVGVNMETYPLWDDHSSLYNPSGRHLPSCYRRLKLFSVEQTRAMGIADGDPVVWIDLDVVFIGDVRPMFNRGENFVGWRGVGSYQPEVYNGTIVMFRAGMVDYLWTEFDPVRTPRLVSQARYFGSDQGWLSYRMSNRGTAYWSTADGMYSFSRDIRPARANWFPLNGRIISFNGKSKPWDVDVRERYSWVKDYWRPEDGGKKAELLLSRRVRRSVQRVRVPA